MSWGEASVFSELPDDIPLGRKGQGRHERSRFVGVDDHPNELQGDTIGEIITVARSDVTPELLSSEMSAQS